MTAQVFENSQTHVSYQGGLDPEKPPKTVLGHDNAGEIGDQTVKEPETRDTTRGSS